MSRWIDVCGLDDLQADSGVCAKVAGRQVALFYLPRLQAVFALDNFDPVAEARVMSRGMVGDLGGEPMVASPMYKQHYSLKTGVCFEDSVSSFRAKLAEEIIQIRQYREKMSLLRGHPLSEEEAAKTWIARNAENFAKVMGQDS